MDKIGISNSDIKIKEEMTDDTGSLRVINSTVSIIEEEITNETMADRVINCGIFIKEERPDETVPDFSTIDIKEEEESDVEEEEEPDIKEEEETEIYYGGLVHVKQESEMLVPDEGSSTHIKYSNLVVMWINFKSNRNREAVCNQLKNALSKLTSGHIDEEELKRKLLSFVSNVQKRWHAASHSQNTPKIAHGSRRFLKSH